MNDTPKYSIITTCKGRLHHLVRSLPQMLRQPDAEVLVVDYSCPDDTAGYVGKNFPAARVVPVPGMANFNPSHARNSGAKHACGETLAFVDADIVLADSFIRSAEENIGPNDFAKFAEPTVPLENSLQGTCVVHRRHFEMIGGYDEVLRDYGGEDLELYDRLAALRLSQATLDRESVIEIIDHGPADRGRFFEKKSSLGFLIGKVYRVAKAMMPRKGSALEIDLAVRESLYNEITRLVRNMEGMASPELRLEINFPDEETRGLHRVWQFSRSVVVHVRRRPNSTEWDVG